jgi:DNA sulfur modification protein DndD
MLLKSVLVKDFRQFKGEQRISFSTDTDRNVTIIMGDNGSGKTTLAQVFTWCLYGDTSFEDKALLCKKTAQNMLPGTDETVKVELTLEHNKTDYVILSEQRYQKDASGSIRSVGQRKFVIAYKKGGQLEYIKESETDLRMKEILPKELSKYFFFDGERIGNMSKEIRRGKSSEFAQAVRSLLGLSAFTAALDHLNGRGRNNVLGVYGQSYDDKSDSTVAELVRQITVVDDKTDKIDDRLLEIESQTLLAQEKCDTLSDRIAKNKDSEILAQEKARLVQNRQRLIDSKSSRTAAILRNFNNGAPNFFAMKMMKDALQALSEAEKLDKGVPFINDKTIQYLIDQKKCICGTDVIVGNEAFNALTKLLDYIPPKSIGNMIGEFVKECETRSKVSSTFFDDFCDNYRFVRDFDNDYAENETAISNIEKRLEGLESVGSLQADLSRYEKAIRDLGEERDRLNRDKGSLDERKRRLDVSKQEHANKNDSNRKIKVYEAYAQYMYDTLFAQYKQSETDIRKELEQTVNEIFRTIYNGGFSLSLDEKYNIQINVIGNEGTSEDIETSTAQSISVIFAFISSVIKMARKSQQPENAMLVSEPYPLVMDAPLSSFDKTRIQTVCKVLPAVAEQVIVFI